MNEAWFEFNGINSLDMHMRIVNDVYFPSPETDIEFIEVLGRDGELAMDNERLKGTTFSIPVRLKLPKNVNVNEVATKISEWLKNDVGWHKLRFSGSEGYDYVAICYEQFNVQETLKQYGSTVINFRIKPYKYRNSSKIINVNNGESLFNPEKRVSKPHIKIIGSGDMRIKNNGEDWLVLRNVDDNIEIDSRLMSAFKDDRPQNDKMIGNVRPLFPVFVPGENKIEWTGNISEIEINPRWEAIT